MLLEFSPYILLKFCMFKYNFSIFKILKTHLLYVYFDIIKCIVFNSL